MVSNSVSRRAVNFTGLAASTDGLNRLAAIAQQMCMSVDPTSLADNYRENAKMKTAGIISAAGSA
jgi:hypothetical protein